MCFQVLYKTSTAGSCKSFGSEFQSVGPATDESGVSGLPQEQTVDDAWQIVDAGDRVLETGHSSL